MRCLEKTYVEQEIETVIHAGKPKQKDLEVVKMQSLQNTVLHKFHNLNNREISQPIWSLTNVPWFDHLKKSLVVVAVVAHEIL
jgi:hypothetical protein